MFGRKKKIKVKTYISRRAYERDAGKMVKRGYSVIDVHVDEMRRENWFYGPKVNYIVTYQKKN